MIIINNLERIPFRTSINNDNFNGFSSLQIFKTGDQTVDRTSLVQNGDNDGKPFQGALGLHDGGFVTRP